MGWIALIIISVTVCITILCNKYMDLCNENNVGMFDDATYDENHFIEIENKIDLILNKMSNNEDKEVN